MEVPFALLAEKVSVDDRGRLNLCGIIEEVIMKSFPVALGPLCLFIRVLGTAFDRGTTKAIECTLIGPDGSLHWSETDYLTIPEDDNRPTPRYDLHYPLPSFEFHQPGSCEFIIKIDREEKARIPLVLESG